MTIDEIREMLRNQNRGYLPSWRMVKTLLARVDELEQYALLLEQGYSGNEAREIVWGHEK